MLLNHFFTIKNIQQGDKNIVNVSLDPKHPVYQGHFPGMPVAPGVCLTQMLQETVEQLTGKKLTMVTGDNLKFTAVLNPEENPEVVITLSLKTKDNGLLQADGTISTTETTFFSFKGSFKEN
ncbi:MAG: 3-hydroxyacyl-ACP dehydratase [Bacteroidota bacterium]|nr:3-hydroxyacyl-ACP dehydratase [Bacteroidota bacterium]